MPQYCIIYLGGDKPSSPEEGKQHMSKYMNWHCCPGVERLKRVNWLI